MKPRKQDDGGSLDSLLDTLTNVVGILVIVLVVTMMDVNQAVQSVESRDIREEDLSEVVASVEQAEVESQALQKQLDELTTEVPPETTIELEAAFSEIETQLQEASRRKQQAQQALQQQEQLKAEEMRAQQLEKQVESERQSVRTLRAKLEEQQEIELPPVRAIALPDPRTAPKGATPRVMICHENTVQFIDALGYRERAEKRASFIIDRKKLDADKAKGIDAQVFKQHFDQRSLSDDDCEVELEIRGNRAFLRLTPREMGEPVEEIADRGSKYQRNLRRLKKENVFIKFVVWPDSYDAYLVARQLANNFELAAGWQAATEHYLIVLPKCLFGPPPKPSPPQDPKLRPLPPQPID